MELKSKIGFKPAKQSKFLAWLLEGQPQPHAPHNPKKVKEHVHSTHPWYQVMCLTGVDYFSTLGYQPAIAFVAAQYLSPFATFVLVLLTLFGAYPVYAMVAKESPNGEGSIAMLQRLLTYWQGKLFVLILLGFAATDFIITITLSAADAAEHIVKNPLMVEKLHVGHHHQMLFTLMMVILLGAVFLKGMREAVGVAILLVLAFLSLNAIVIGRSIIEIVNQPEFLNSWKEHLMTEPKYKGGNIFVIIGLALMAFPKLALGLSGFETGVAVMPLVKGAKTDTAENPAGRVAATRKLLLCAALIMSVMLITSSFVTTLLIPSAEFEPSGQASGRALAYLAYKYIGNGFGIAYDISTILILWFAGASAMAGLLNLVPRYLPRYGMAPEWAKSNRPLVLIFTSIAILVTILFKANVNAQGGAYATGVLALMVSAAVASTIATRKRYLLKKLAFGLISLVFIYTFFVNVSTAANAESKPGDGLRIAAFFILGVVIISFISRIWRTLELRINSVELDLRAIAFVRDAVAGGGALRIIPNRPTTKDRAEYEEKEREARRDHDIPESDKILFIEITIGDASNFAGDLKVRGYEVEGYRVLRASGVAVPNSLAALLLHLRELTGKRPHAYFNWGERNPGQYLIKFLFSGEGDIAPLTREILRRVEPKPEERPVIHAAS